MKKIECERKFLVEFPKSWSKLSELMDNLVDVKRISQTYLKPKGNEPCARVRKTIAGLTGDLETVFHYNKKKFVKDGVHEEEENQISKEKYDSFLKDAHPDKFAVEKTRFLFKYKDQIFELDVFKGPLKGLAILELELKNIDDHIDLPPFLSVIKEVTDSKKFTNFALADKK